jgi:hypothetical protein
MTVQINAKSVLENDRPNYSAKISFGIIVQITAKMFSHFSMIGFL